MSPPENLGDLRRRRYEPDRFSQDPGSRGFYCRTRLPVQNRIDMSIEAMALALHHSKASGTAKLILVGIANHDGDGGAYPSIATLAKYGGIHPRNVKRALKTLVELGEIRIDYQGGGDRHCQDFERPNLYHVLLRCPAECDGTTKHKTPRAPGDANVTPRVTAASWGGVTAASPKPSSEPSPEPSSASEQVPMTARRRAATPTSSESKQKRKPRMTVKEDRAIWHQVIEADYEDYASDELDEIYKHWNTRFDWPGCFARDLQDKGQLDGFLGGAGIDLGLYDEEPEGDPWTTSA